MKQKKQKLWFKAKRFGWGWVPATWEGWAVTAGYALVLWWGFSVNQWFWLWAATFTLILICFKKGEKPRWRWGK